MQTPFGLAMRARGLVAYDENSLNMALEQMAKDNVDSDGDAMSDLDELRAGRDPNVPGTGTGIENILYGCGVAQFVNARNTGYSRALTFATMAVLATVLLCVRKSPLGTRRRTVGRFVKPDSGQPRHDPNTRLC